jgi:DNA-binding IclR family transcriptional regulator
MSEAKATGTQSIDRASDLLVRILGADKPLTLSELVAQTGLAKGTTSRILSALERSGLIERSSVGGFTAGPVLNQYAIKGGAYSALVASMTPVLTRIAAQTRETASLAVAGHSGIDNIAQENGDYILGSRNWIGESAPLHCSAAGKVLMAFGAAGIPRTLPALTPETITDFVVLDEQLRIVRERGYSVIRNELEPGLVSVSVPVIGSRGIAIAAVSVSGPAQRIGLDDEARIALTIKHEIQVASTNQHDLTRSQEGAA